MRRSAAALEQESAEGIEESRLRRLLTNTIDTIEDNKTQIFDIYQNTRSELEQARQRLIELKKNVTTTIERVDELAAEEQQAKQRLAEVSSRFSEFSEDEIRKTYESVSIIQINLAIEREKEQQMRVERDKLEIRLRYLFTMVERAEHMALAIGSVLSYLSTQVSGVIWKIEAVQKDKFVGARIIKATEEERYRISREIHDGPAQDLANALFTTSITERLMDQGTGSNLADIIDGRISGVQMFQSNGKVGMPIRFNMRSGATLSMDRDPIIYVDGVRWGNETDTRAYIRGVRAGENVRIPEDGERTETTAMEEYAFLALRTAEGIDEADFRRTFGIGLDEVYGGVVRRYTERGMLRRAAGYTALTAAGMKRGNEVFAAFLRDA